MYLLAFTCWSRFILYSSLFHCCVFHITSTHVGDLIVKDMLFLYKYFPKLCMLMYVSTGRADRLIVIYAGWWFHFWWMNTSCLWLSCHLTLLFLMSYCLFALFFSSLSSLLICLCCFCFSVLPLASLSLSLHFVSPSGRLFTCHILFSLSSCNFLFLVLFLLSRCFLGRIES